jgi:DNA polymerase theta
MVSTELCDPALELSKEIIQGFANLGITKLHKWQRELLLSPSIFTTKNLLYTAPTSAGKSLVYEIIMLKRIQQTLLKSIIIVPFISIVREIVTKLNAFNLRVLGFFGTESTLAIDEYDIAVCTIEKANSIINRLIEDGQINFLSTVVVDELHLLGDKDRGYLLELMLTKLMISCPEVKIVGMSATLPNITSISAWLDALLYTTDFRPVPLVEFIKLGDEVMDQYSNTVKMDVDLVVAKKLGDPDLLIPIVYETVKEFHSVLIFCSTKLNTENTAKNIARLIKIQYDPFEIEDIMHRRKLLVQELVESDPEADENLKYCITKGVAFHHSGLTLFEREIIESGYRKGAILILCATSTLASGVNVRV